MGNRYDKFKHKVRTNLPDSVRYKTVCRKCRKSPRINDKCLTCKIERAVEWGQAW